jgi:hypothetical protein
MADPNTLRKVPTFNPRPASAAAMARPEQKMLTVKAKVDTRQDKNGNEYQSPRVVYDDTDQPIPHMEFATVPLTVSLVLALKAGDLIEAEPTPGLEEGTLPAEFGGRLTAKTNERDGEERR